MIDARSESLRSTLRVEKPLVLVGTTKPRMVPLRGPSSASVRAQTIATSAMPPLVIHALVPLST